MSALLELADAELLAPADITRQQAQALLGRLSGSAIDLGELFFQHRRSESWALEEGRVKEGRFSLDRGLGVRALSGEKTGFAYAEDISLAGLQNAVAAARSIARAGGEGRIRALQPVAAPPRYQGRDPIPTLSERDKVALLERTDLAARRLDNRVQEVSVRLSASHDIRLAIGTDGTLAADARPLVRMDVSVILVQDGRRELGYAGGGGRRDLSAFAAGGCERLAQAAVRAARINLEAVPAPAGPMTVVLGPGWPGILLHEAVGHGLEGDFNRKGSSAYAGRIGQQVASPACTLIDDGTLADRRGSLSMDDEGTPSAANVLIEGGVLKGYLQDKLNARLMGVAPTGNGRRQSYAWPPMPRMTNTFLQPGGYAPEEILASCDKGLYAASFGGGEVDISSGQFVFSATEAYLIEGGKLTRPVRGASLIGNGPEAMTRISMLGSDFALDDGVGVCGKDGQSVPVGVGQPSLKVDELVVGGTQG